VTTWWNNRYYVGLVIWRYSTVVNRRASVHQTVLVNGQGHLTMWSWEGNHGPCRK